MALVLDLVDPQEMLGYVRGIQIEEDRNRFVLSAFLPNAQVDEIEWRITTADLVQPDAAMVRAWDTEAPIGKRQGLRRMSGELPPISQKMRLGEEERLRRRALERGDNTGITDAIYNDTENLTRAVLSRVEMLRGEVLTTGKCIFNENGVQATVDYGRKASHNVQAAVKWDTATPTILADMRSWVQTYIDTNGVAPAYALTSTQVISSLLTRQEFRDLVNQGVGAPGIVTLSTIQSILQAFGLPPLVPYDTQVRVGGALTKVINPKLLTLMPPQGEPLGKTIWGTTAESLQLAEVNAIATADAPGLVQTVHKMDDPVSTWTKVAGIVLPVVPNPDLTFTAQVLT